MNDQILKKAAEIKNLYTNKNIEPEKYINELNYTDNKAIIELNRLGDNEEKNKLMQRELVKKLKIDLKIAGVKISYATTAKGKSLQVAPTTKVIAIVSGKGGVGKSQVTVNLAQALARAGKKVGIIDADIYGYSIPKILDLYEEPAVANGLIQPLNTNNGIQVISSQYFIEGNENKAIIWRGPMLNKMLGHFFYDIAWSKQLDYLLIDMPPGTGDVMLNISSYVEEISTILVTTPSIDAAHVALRVGQLSNDLHFEQIGIIENMSYYEVKGEKHHIFGQGGAEMIAQTLNIPVIGQVPIEQDKQKMSEIYDQVISNLLGVNNGNK